MRIADDQLRAGGSHGGRVAGVCRSMAVAALLVSGASAGSRGEDVACHPEPPPKPFAERDTPYSMVYFGWGDDPDHMRWMLESNQRLGATKTQLLTYWWKQETLGGDYWKEMGYQPNHVGEQARKALDDYIRMSHELGMKPGLRLGSFRVFKGLYHPMDPTGSVEKYGDWLRHIAKRYRGKIDHYVLGDEENKNFPEWGWVGTPENYLNKVLIPLATAIKEGDPDAQVSCTSVSSAPATDWVMELIRLGLPKYADGIAGNYDNRRIEDLIEMADLMERVRAVWPEAKFYANGVGYADHRGLHDAQQAGEVAQTMFTLWDIGWESAPYYFYTFSRTADTLQNFGLMSPPSGDEPAVYADAWYAYQTIAQTFYNRDEMRSPGFAITLRQAEVLTAPDGSTIRLAPPDPILRSYVRAGGQLLVYVAYRHFREPRNGKWDVLLDTMEWGGPQQIPLLDHKQRVDLPHRCDGGNLVIPDVQVSIQPTIISLRRVKK